ncbi:MAG: hypothetical protein O6943_08350 [Bacteroidetes bacterium]|nr:hypothetical protein [Bacteroidota bacterium]
MLIRKKKIPVRELITVGILPSGLKKFIYRLKGYNIGKNVSLGFGSVIIGKDVTIQDNTSIGHMTVIRGRSIHIGRFVKIGSMTFIDTEKIFIDDDARINEQVIIGGIKNPDSYIKIGKRAIIMEYSFLNPTKPLIIGDDTGIGGHCLLFTHGSWLSQLDGYPVAFAPITLGKNVWLPWRVFIMPGVEIGDNVVIGANSLINKSLPANCLAAGTPAKVIKENFPERLPEEKRTSIIYGILDNFVEHLSHNDYNVEKTEIEKGVHLTIRNHETVHHLTYLTESCENGAISGTDNLYVIDYSENSEAGSLENGCKMKVNLRNKKRIGSSQVGEEFVTYISRYGVRFDRLD